MEARLLLLASFVAEAVSRERESTGSVARLRGSLFVDGGRRIIGGRRLSCWSSR